MTNRTVKALLIGLALVLFAGLVVGLVFAPPWFWHPLGACTGTPAQVIACKSYNFYSGSFSDLPHLALTASVIVALIAFWRKHNCHVHGCWALAWHPHPQHGHPVCKRHHPEHPKGGGSRVHAHEHPEQGWVH